MENKQKVELVQKEEQPKNLEEALKTIENLKKGFRKIKTWGLVFLPIVASLSVLTIHQENKEDNIQKENTKNIQNKIAVLESRFSHYSNSFEKYEEDVYPYIGILYNEIKEENWTEKFGVLRPMTIEEFSKWNEKTIKDLDVLSTGIDNDINDLKELIKVTN